MIDERRLINLWFQKIGDSYMIYFPNLGINIMYDISWTLFVQNKVLNWSSNIIKYQIKSISYERLRSNIASYQYLSNKKLGLSLIANDLNHSITINGSTGGRYT